MRNVITSTILVFCVFGFISCSRLENTIADDIKRNKKKYTEIVETIYNCDFSRFKMGQYISYNYFPQKLKEALNQTELKNKIKYLILIQDSNCNLLSIELISGRYQIMYVPCPESDFPKPDSYKEEGLIEIWGINKNWFIWKDNDYM